AQQLGDFTSLLLRVADDAPSMFDHVIVDEAQDLSPLQLKFLRAVGRHAKFWFIGDPDQSIYSFRGSHAGMIQQLIAESDLRFDLLTNYRSSQAIVRHAGNVVALNPNRLDLRWSAFRESAGAVTVTFFEDGDTELTEVLAWLNAPGKSRCLLARTRAQLEPFQ